MKIIHTSDWHLGASLYGQKRFDESRAFLSWLEETIKKNDVDTILIAGDIFDSTNPPNLAQKLYYNFLAKIAAHEKKRNIVIIAGNHDSPTLLNAAQNVLKNLNIHVVSEYTENNFEDEYTENNFEDEYTENNFEKEIIILNDHNNKPYAIVCAVPYLRDKDLRSSESHETIQAKEQKLKDGLHQHYKKIAKLAQKKRKDLGTNIPIIAMGHLFASGASDNDDDGTRSLYIGTALQVSAKIFDECFNYVALGHIHKPQKVNNNDYIRYSGSPIPIGFNEAKYQKSIVLIEIQPDKTKLQTIDVPLFQKLEKITATPAKIIQYLEKLIAENANVWLQIEIQPDPEFPNIIQQIDDLTKDTKINVLRSTYHPHSSNTQTSEPMIQKYEDIEDFDFFEAFLSENNIPEEQRPQLRLAYEEIYRSIITKENIQ